MKVPEFTGVVWPVERVRITMPFRATWTQFYTAAKPHKGIDTAPWAGSAGRPVRSPLAGRVVSAETNPATPGGLGLTIEARLPADFGALDLDGNYVGIPAGHPLRVRMLHHAKLLVSEGQTVTTGQEVAVLGNSGTFTTGPHVHLEVMVAGRMIDPEHLFMAWMVGYHHVVEHLVPAGG